MLFAIIKPVFTAVLSATVLLSVVSGPLASAEADGRVLLAFPQAQLEAERSLQAPSHQVMLSAIREVGDELRAERSVRVAVEGAGRLYQITGGASRQDAMRWYLEQLQTRNATILFRCRGRECGRSNVWANQVFDQATLYGRDAQQDYLVAGLEDNDGERWLVVLYTITRGNQREYLWVEQLRVADDAVIPGLNESAGRLAGPVVVPWEGDISIRFSWDGETRRLLTDMAADPASRIVIAGFASLRPGETVEQSLARSEKAARTMSDLLDRSGVSSSRHIVRNIGPLVRFSAPGRPDNRIEILVVGPPEGGSTDE